MCLLAYIPVLEQSSAPERERERRREVEGGDGGRERGSRGRERPFEAKAQYRQSAPPARLASPASTPTLAFHLLPLPLPPQPQSSPPRVRTALLRKKQLPPRQHERGECVHRFAVGVRALGGAPRPRPPRQKVQFELARSPAASHPNCA